MISKYRVILQVILANPASPNQNWSQNLCTPRFYAALIESISFDFCAFDAAFFHRAIVFIYLRIPTLLQCRIKYAAVKYGYLEDI